MKPKQVRQLTFVDLLRSLTPGAAWTIAGIIGAVFVAGYGLRKFIDPPAVHAQAARLGGHQLRETAIGTADGVNRAFMLQRTPSDPAQVKVWLGGLLMDRDRYTISGRALTFLADTTPAKDESVEAEY